MKVKEKSPVRNFKRPVSGGVMENHKSFDVDEFEDVIIIEPDLPSCSSQNAASMRKNRCEFCDQPQDTILSCSEPLPGALKEEDVLISVKTTHHNETPCLNLSHFRVYDDIRHLCAFDGNLLKTATCLYFSGIVKPFDSEPSDRHDQYACEDIGPIQDWWIEEKDEKSVIGLSSKNAYYYLEKPMPEYFPFIKSLTEKVFVRNMVIAVLQKESHELDYAQLLNILSTVKHDGMPSITESILLRHGSFICQQVQLFDNDADNEAKILSLAPCVCTLAAKVNFDYNDVQFEDDSDEDDVDEMTDEDTEDMGSNRQKKSGVNRNRNIIGKKKLKCIVTTTPLVQSIFMDFLTGHGSIREPDCCKELGRSEETNSVENSSENINKDFEDVDNFDEENTDDDFEDMGRNLRRNSVGLSENRSNIETEKLECMVTATPLVGSIFMDFLTHTRNPNYCKEFQIIAPTVSPAIPQAMEVEIDQDQNHKVPSNTQNFDLKKDQLTDHQSSKDIPPCESNLRICLPVVRVLKSIKLERLSEEVLDFYLHKHQYNVYKSLERRKYLQQELEKENNSVSRSGLEISVGDFVSVCNSSSIAHVKRLYENGSVKKFFHAQWFIRSIDTILAEAGHPNELFVTDQCEDVLLTKCCKIVTVEHVPTHSDWSDNGNIEYINKLNRNEDPTCCFYYQKRYCSETARFEDWEPESLSCCYRKEKLESFKNPVLIDDELNEKRNMVRWRDEEYRVGCCIFLNPGTIMHRETQGNSEDVLQLEDDTVEEDCDEDLFPERYRRPLTKKKNEVVRDPFDIAYVCNIWSKKRNRPITESSDILLNVKKFYRPQNTWLPKERSRTMDLNLLFSSDEDCTVNFSDVQGKCYVSYKENLSCSVDEWSKKGPYRFYFTESYDKTSKSFASLPAFAMKIGKIEGLDGENNVEVPPEYPPVAHLRSFDVFCGCGGLTCGLEEANIARCQWAVDQNRSSSQAFKLNFPDATVFNEDANIILKAIMENKTTYQGQKLPQKGEVDLLCGGPPCQGFSLLNRHPEGLSKFGNTLVPTFLSYCDHLKPRFFILENVRHFVRHKSNVFKLTLNCLVRMGYQTAFFVLQSGGFGIPQSRSRVVIIAAAPGEVLPVQPERWHTCIGNLSFETTLDDLKYSAAKWKTSAPYRMIDVYDAISDLPPIKRQASERSYTMEPITHFQRQLRIRNGVEESILYDHICAPVNALNEKRISFIPKNSRCDWRDLPNIEVRLRDGTWTRKLQYTHGPKSPKGAFRGVCSCYTSGKCSRKYRQRWTLIPWCLSHSANRNQQWNGSFSRLRFDYVFQSASTSVHSMGRGNTWHPIENRIVSVREYARSVGFPDEFQFHGFISAKYRQIGNCVAPPLAKAIGLQIREAVSKSNAAGADVRMSS